LKSERIFLREYAKFLKGKCTNRKFIRLFLLEKFGHRCACCKRTTWNKKPITLWVDHKDGNASNNKPKNFQLICPNCDTQQDTFGAKNYGFGRKSLGLPPIRLIRRSLVRAQVGEPNQQTFITTAPVWIRTH
jgi:hypothetical protein